MVKAVVDWDLMPTVYSPWFVEALALVTTSPKPVHLKVDTGMHRVGAVVDQAVAIAMTVARHSTLVLEGVWSHLAVADTDPDYTEVQRDRFAGVLGDLALVGIEPPLRHLANTAGIFLGREYWFDMVRPGIGVYGLSPHPDRVGPLDLVPALRLESAVSHVQRLSAGERPSYGRRRPLKVDSTVVTVPIGYADGYGRGLSDADVLIGGERYPLAGTVTMDQIMVDVGDADVRLGDEVVLIGRQGRDEITATELAGRLGTINYEVVCRLGPRLRRVYET
jgi:alanine racemase